MEVMSVGRRFHEVATALQRLLPPGVRSDAWHLDRHPLRPGELALVEGCVDVVVRATSTGRALAHSLLATRNADVDVIGRGAHGEPLWPAGVIGSIAHDDTVALVAVGSGGPSFGIDVEPAAPLPEDLLEVIATPRELPDLRTRIRHDVVAGRMRFCVKEAVYKACFPVDGRFLEFADVEVSPADGITSTAGTFQTRAGLTGRWRAATAAGHLIAVAVVDLPAAS